MALLERLDFAWHRSLEVGLGCVQFLLPPPPPPFPPPKEGPSCEPKGTSWPGCALPCRAQWLDFVPNKKAQGSCVRSEAGRAPQRKQCPVNTWGDSGAHGGPGAATSGGGHHDCCSPWLRRCSGGRETRVRRACAQCQPAVSPEERSGAGDLQPGQGASPGRCSFWVWPPPRRPFLVLGLRARVN